MTCGKLIRRSRGDRRGSIAPLVGVVISVLFGFAGLGVDIGMVYLEKRRVQSAADLAALAAARANNGGDAVLRALADNGYPSPNALTVTGGTYTSNRALPVADRFVTGGSLPNATRVQLSSSVKAGFSRVVGGPASYTVTGTATARRADLASVSVGSRLLGLDAGLANALLSRLLGTTITLSLADYRALAEVNVDALSVLREAAPKVGIQAGTYNEVLNAKLPLGDLMAALNRSADRASATVQALTALNTLSTVLGSAGTSIRLAGLITAGEIGDTPLSRNSQALWVNAFDMLTGAAFVANGTNQVSLDLAANVPGLLRTRVSLRVGEQLRTSGFVGTGASLTTAQKRILVEVWVPGPLLLPEIYLPIYVEVAPAKATVRSVTCPWRVASERAVTLTASTGVAYLAIGDVSPLSLDPGMPRPALAPAKLLQALFLTVGASASAEFGASTQTLTFSDADIRAGRSKTVSTTNLTSSLTATLLSNLDLRLNGTTLGNVLELRAALAAALGAVAAPIDTLLFSVLNIAGVKVGSADVSVTGTYCGGAALVQ